MNIKEYIKQWAESYKTDLIENIMPFWMEHGLDRKHGGVYTCVNRDGSLIDTTKKCVVPGTLRLHLCLRLQQRGAQSRMAQRCKIHPRFY